MKLEEFKRTNMELQVSVDHTRTYVIDRYTGSSHSLETEDYLTLVDQLSPMLKKRYDRQISHSKWLIDYLRKCEIKFKIEHICKEEL